MGLDIRWPIGLMFSLVGALLVIYGFATLSDTEVYRRSLDININLRWGVVVLIFGVWMLWMAWRASRQPVPQPTPEKK
jgi:protein-S-isoprenylcysteine O-methyltransferase Ste14